jgi:hypothetical protein
MPKKIQTAYRRQMIIQDITQSDHSSSKLSDN